jgi:hypothetical protein
MRKFLALVPLALLALVACSQKSFDSRLQITPEPVPGADFTHYKTWMFGRAGEYPATGIEHMDTPQFRAAAGKHFRAEMTKLGYTETNDNADFVMLLHVAGEVKFDQQKMDEVYEGYDMAWSQISKDDVWNEGTMIIFAMDNQTGKQLWSSTAQARLEDYVGYQDRLERFNKVVTLMLADFPKATP